METNPAKEIKLLRSENPGGHHTWTSQKVRKYIDYHPPGTKAHIALFLMLFTGARRSNAVRIGQQMEFYEDGIMWPRFVEEKGNLRKRKNREIPILPQLAKALAASPSDNMTYITNRLGKPYTPESFGNAFRKWRDTAGLQHCSAHGLRKAGATIAAENGATEHQLMAILVGNRQSKRWSIPGTRIVHA